MVKDSHILPLRAVHNAIIRVFLHSVTSDGNVGVKGFYSGKKVTLSGFDLMITGSRV